MLKNINPTNEALAIVSALIIAVVALVVLGADAEGIASAIGGGFVGYIARGVVSS